MQYIPLAEIAELTPYSEGHLIMLARRGKLKTVKHGETYYTTLEWVDDYLMWLDEKLESVRGHSTTQVSSYKTEEPKLEPLPQPAEPASVIPNDQLLSTAEIENHTPYSAAYLSLRIRQGKLQGKKQGRNWYTTLAWINEYVAAHGAVVAPVAPTPTPVIAQPVITAPAVSTPAPILAEERQGDDIPNFKLPSFQLPKLSLPKLSLPKISLPSVHLPRPNFSFLKAKAFQRVTAGSLLALVLALTFSQQPVRASFYDWSQATATAAKQAAVLTAQAVQSKPAWSWPAQPAAA